MKRKLALLAVTCGLGASCASVGALAQGWTTVLGPGVYSPYVVGGTGGVLITTLKRSTDGGKTWIDRTDPGRDQWGETVYPVLSNPSQFYSTYSTYVGQNPVYLSQFTADAGATWSPANLNVRLPSTGLVYNYLDDLAPVGKQPGRIYAMAYSQSCGFGCLPPGAVAPMRSEDGGATWTSIAGGLDTFSALRATPADPDLAYVATGKGLFASRDAGATWTAIRTEPNLSVVPDFQDAGTVYAYAKANSSGGPIFVSSDRGTTWHSVATPNLRGTFTLTADPFTAGRAYAVSGSVAFQTLDRGATWQQVAADEDGLQHLSYEAPSAFIASGDSRTLFRAVSNGVSMLSIAPHPLVLDTDIWWDPAQSGWGLSIAQHQDGQVVAVWYYYDAQGNARWAVIPGGTWSGQTFSGTLYRATGPSFFSGVGFDPLQVVLTPWGSATLRFSDANTADISFAFSDGTRFDHHVVRQAFGAPDDAAVMDLTGLWWNSTQSGWGITFHQHFSTVFATWFVYDAVGQPTWLFVSNLTAPSNGWVLAPLYSATGPRYDGPYDPAKVAVTAVGNFYFDPARPAPSFTLSPVLRYQIPAPAPAIEIPISKEPF